jgi:hypothetical protein
MRRLRRLGWAGLLSLVLHAVVLLLLWRVAPTPSVRPGPSREKAVEVEIRTVPPVARVTPPPPDTEPLPPPKPPGPKTAPPKPAGPKPAPPEVARREPPATPAPEGPEAPPPEPPPPAPPPDAPRLADREPAPDSDRPTADAPLARAPGSPPLNLLPPSSATGGVIISTPENSRGEGRTVRPGDPSLSAEARTQAEHARVSDRVQDIVQERQARDRVDTGRIHPYFGQLRAKLEQQMDAPPLFDMPSVPKQMLYSYAEKARRFGAMGSTGDVNLPRQAPRPSELLDQRARSEPAFKRLRGQAQAGEELQDFAHGVSTLKLTVTLELLQAPDGVLREVKLISRSGNPAYDDYVLQSVPTALSKFPAPPSDALGVHADGIRSVWAVEGRVVYVRKLSEMKKGSDSVYLAALAAMGLLAGGFEETTGEVHVIDVRNPHFECRSRLLRVY